jgi:hypothetical protein
LVLLRIFASNYFVVLLPNIKISLSCRCFYLLVVFTLHFAFMILFSSCIFSLSFSKNRYQLTIFFLIN